MRDVRRRGRDWRLRRGQGGGHQGVEGEEDNIRRCDIVHVEYLVSSIDYQYPLSSILHLVSCIDYPISSIEYPEWSMENTVSVI